MNQSSNSSTTSKTHLPSLQLDVSLRLMQHLADVCNIERSTIYRLINCRVESLSLLEYINAKLDDINARRV